MPAKGRHDLIDGLEPTETLEAKEEIQVESKAVGVVHATDSAPRVRANEHSGLRNEVGPPWEYSRGPRTCPTNPQFPALIIYVAAVSKRHHSAGIGVQGGGRCGQ